MYNCPICEDKGLKIIKKNGVDYATPCFCEMKRVKRLLFGEYFENKNLDNYEDRSPSMRDAKKEILKDPFKSYFIYGNVGLGKTHLLAGIYEKLYDGLRYLRTAVSTEANLFRDIKEKGFYSLAGRDYFIIDDVGKVKMAQWDIQTLYEFYNEIYRRKLILTISSNYSLPEIAEIYGGAITRRIEERCEILQIKGE